MKIVPLDHPDLPSLEMPARFRTEIVYFTTPSGKSGAPVMGTDEYWIRTEDAVRWLEEMVVFVVSPLDSRSRAEIELTDYQEAWLQWLVDHGVQHVRVIST